jgi:type VI secretion system protein ImpK
MKYNKEVDELTIDNLLQESVIFFLDAKDKTPEVSSGEVLYRQGVMIVESLQSALQAHAIHRDAADHILYAVCALLDETMMSTGNDSWHNAPLQVHFFQSFNAGNELYERIRQQLRQPVPDIAVITAFHRVLCLGFLGKYSKTPGHADRQQLLQQLTSLITCDPSRRASPVVVRTEGASGLAYWRSPWLKVVLSFLLLMALSLGLQLHLHALITTMDIAH